MRQSDGLRVCAQIGKRMTDKNNGDELIEITSDVGPAMDDEDMKIVSEKPVSDGSVTEEDFAEKVLAEEDFVDEVIMEDDLSDDETVSNEPASEENVQEEPVWEEPADEEAAQEESIEAANAPEDNTENEAAEEISDDAVPEEDIDPEDFSKEFAEVEEDEEDNALVMEIGESLSKQIQADIISEEKEREKEERRKNRASVFAGIPWWAYAAGALVCLIIGFVIWVGVSTTGQKLLLRIGSRYAAGEVNYKEVEKVDHVDVPDEVDSTPSKAVAADDVVVPIFDWEKDESTTAGSAETVVTGPKEVYNILIAGEENIAAVNERGRTDLLMIASINVTDRRLMLTSVLRDSLVAIPGNSTNKINAAYAIGGMSLLYETFEQNFGITFDNYVLVGFDDFEELIDMAGGVEITLSADEAEYLRKTNYITDKANRKSVVAGKNIFNGDQALGYCRVRKVDSVSGENGDFGRTERQRKVMGELFNSISEMHRLQQISFMNKCLPYLMTDLTADDIERYVGMLVEIGQDTKLETLRIPLNGSCTEATLRGMKVVQLDLDVNSRALRYFIYGDGN